MSASAPGLLCRLLITGLRSAELVTRVTEPSLVTALSTARNCDSDDHGAQDPGAGLTLGQQPRSHTAPTRADSTVAEAVPRHQINTRLSELLVEGEQSLSLVRSTIPVQSWSAGQTCHVSLSPGAGVASTGAAAPGPPTAVLVQTGE